MLPPSDTAPDASRVHGSLDRLARGLDSRVMLAALVLLGAVLRIYQYAADRSLWLDEAALAHNIIQRGFGQLVAPLDYAQIAPLGFLWLEKCAVVLFGSSEYAFELRRRANCRIGFRTWRLPRLKRCTVACGSSSGTGTTCREGRPTRIVRAGTPPGPIRR